MLFTTENIADLYSIICSQQMLSLQTFLNITVHAGVQKCIAEWKIYKYKQKMEK